jgi:chromosome segregation ATPase
MVLSNYQPRRNSRDSFQQVTDLAVNLADSKSFTSPINHLGTYGTPTRKLNSAQKNSTVTEIPTRSEIKPPIRMQYEQNPNYYKQQYKESHELVIPEKDLVELHDKILQRDEILIQKDGQLDQCRAHITELQEEIGKQEAKLAAVELYASEVQRKNDLIGREMNEKNTRINELETADWIRKAQELQVIESLNYEPS